MCAFMCGPDVSIVVGGATEFTSQVGGGVFAFLDLMVERIVALSGSSGAKASMFQLSAPGDLATGLTGCKAFE